MSEAIIESVLKESRRITLKDAEEFIDAFNRAGRGKAKARLVGSILTKGYSDHDVDIVVDAVSKRWAEEQMEKFEGEYPFYYEIMRKIRAKYTYQTQETSEFVWRGLLIDVQEGYE